MQKFDFLAIGSATRDIFVQSPAFRIQRPWHGRGAANLVLPLGAKIDLDAPVLATGGGATNAAATFRNFGYSVSYLGAVGNDDNGEAVMEDLQARSIVADFVFRPPGFATAFSVIVTTGSHGRVVLTYRPPGEFVPAHYQPLKKLNARWLYVTSLAGKLSLAASLFATAKKRGMKIAWNPGNDELVQRERALRLLAAIDVLLVNRDEAGTLLHRPNATMSELCHMVGQYMKGIAVVSDGQRGLCALEHQAMYSVAAHTNIPVIESTGAGDAMGSGFLVGLVRTQGNMNEAVQYGLANAESVIQKIGAKNGLLKRPPIVAQRSHLTVRHFQRSL